MINNSTTVRDLLNLCGIQEILNYEGLTEIAVNGPYGAWFDVGSGWQFKELPELSYNLAMSLAKSLCVFAGLTQPLSESNSVASVILPDGERGQIAIPPATLANIVSFTIRKPSTSRFSLDDYQNTGRFFKAGQINLSDNSLSDIQTELMNLKKENQFNEFFKLAIVNNLNILIVGGTGSGKTTVMKAMVDHYPSHKRLFTIEDVHELSLPLHSNHLHLFYKRGGLSPREIIESCMRMKPDHVLLAELRGDEAWSYLELLNTGHQGSITTIHANDCISAYSRLASLIKQSDVGKTLELDHIMKVVKTSIDVVAFFEHTYLKELYFDPLMKNTLLRGSL